MPNCRRCQRERPLIRAHIIPKAFWNLPDQNVGPLAMISDKADWKAKPSPIGPYDKQILCEECDGIIGLLDQHASETMLRDRSKTSYQEDIAGLYKYTNANTQKIIAFIVSLAWRASISSHPFFERVNLGQFEDKFFELMENGHCPELDNCILINEYDQDTPIMDPHMSRIGNIKTLAFQADRFLFHIKVDRRKFPAELELFTLHSDHVVISMLKSWDTSIQRDAMLKIAKNVTKPKFWKNIGGTV